jgi:halimadienyl-diphosphate synthase
VGHSPAATAYYLLQTGGNAHALTYLNQAMHAGSVPPVTPIDVFERGWVLWNLTLTPEWLEKALFASIQPHLEFLDSFWHPTQGIGFASAYEAKDADGTSVVQSVLSHFGRPKQIETVLFYEEATYFRCFSLEANYSTSANIHVLDALMRAGLDPAHPSVRKVVQFLSKEQHSAGFWRDKWHASPYYTTSHAMIALAPLAHPGIQGAIQWMLSTQNKKGGWGFYLPTAEETAYCVQALIWCYKMGFAVPQEAIQRGATWLRGHRTPPYPPLWIGKCLYAPVNVIRSTILSALMLAESL